MELENWIAVNILESTLYKKIINERKFIQINKTSIFS